jgi:DNA mismatch endonuclease (patch repair protein)
VSPLATDTRPLRAASWASSPGVRRSMQANRRVDTVPEQRLRSALHRRGLRFRKDHRIDAHGLRVRADVVFPRARVAVFVDGCFWHCCPDHTTQPKTHQAYWSAKLRGNIKRDRSVDAALESAAWTVIRVWEHERSEEAASRIEAIVRPRPEVGTRGC